MSTANHKISLPVLLSILLISMYATPARADSITNLGGITPAEFHNLSDDLGATLSYKPVSPPIPLGPDGFDMGIEATQSSMATSTAVWTRITDTGLPQPKLTLPKLHFVKGLPYGIDVGMFYTKAPASNITAYGAELRYAFWQSSAGQFTAIRGAMTKYSGSPLLWLRTYSLDLSLAQDLDILLPYVGIGRVWVNSLATNTATLQQENITQGKVYAGLNMNLTFCNLTIEWDKTGPVQSRSFKLGYRF